MATLEEATYCPKCKAQGKMVKETPGSRGGKVFVIHCQNEVCPWLGTGWVVQVKSDGTVAERQQGPKVYEHLSAADKRIAEKLLREVRDHE